MGGLFLFGCNIIYIQLLFLLLFCFCLKMLWGCGRCCSAVSLLIFVGLQVLGIVGIRWFSEPKSVVAEKTFVSIVHKCDSDSSSFSWTLNRWRTKMLAQTKPPNSRNAKLWAPKKSAYLSEFLLGGSSTLSKTSPFWLHLAYEPTQKQPMRKRARAGMAILSISQISKGSSAGNSCSAVGVTGWTKMGKIKLRPLEEDVKSTRIKPKCRVEHWIIIKQGQPWQSTSHNWQTHAWRTFGTMGLYRIKNTSN